MAVLVQLEAQALKNNIIYIMTKTKNKIKKKQTKKQIKKQTKKYFFNVKKKSSRSKQKSLRARGKGRRPLALKVNDLKKKYKKKENKSADAAEPDPLVAYSKKDLANDTFQIDAQEKSDDTFDLGNMDELDIEDDIRMPSLVNETKVAEPKHAKSKSGVWRQRKMEDEILNKNDDKEETTGDSKDILNPLSYV